MMIHKVGLATLVLSAALLAINPTRTFAEEGGSETGVLGKLWQGIKQETSKIEDDARRMYESTPRQGSCQERRARILAVLPDALTFVRLARNVYDSKHEAQMRSAGLSTLDLGSGRTAYYESAGRRYAEVHIDEAGRRAVVVFRGTRLTVQSDVSTDVTNFVGLPSGYYRWASALAARVVRDHPRMQVVATGHSLGGGLAIYAVLRNPGVKGFAFNPAGLAKLTWAKTSRAERARTNAALTVVSTRNGQVVEPVTATSLAGGSVLPGHVIVLESDALNPVALHSATAVVTALERVDANHASGSVCDGDLGVLAH
ncbi:MAG: hypothetical protein J2P50_06310 [Hyphomicrobiaceae bacterium]|nr:hypothetical protein [Hyphomicrobiaceae bacterium]